MQKVSGSALLAQIPASRLCASRRHAARAGQWLWVSRMRQACRPLQNAKTCQYFLVFWVVWERFAAGTSRDHHVAYQDRIEASMSFSLGPRHRPPGCTQSIGAQIHCTLNASSTQQNYCAQSRNVLLVAGEPAANGSSTADALAVREEA